MKSFSELGAKGRLKRFKLRAKAVLLGLYILCAVGFYFSYVNEVFLVSAISAGFAFSITFAAGQSMLLDFGDGKVIAGLFCFIAGYSVFGATILFFTGYFIESFGMSGYLAGPAGVGVGAVALFIYGVLAIGGALYIDKRIEEFEDGRKELSENSH